MKQPDDKNSERLRAEVSEWTFEPADASKDDPGRCTRFWGKVKDGQGRFISAIGQAHAEALFARSHVETPNRAYPDCFVEPTMSQFASKADYEAARSTIERPCATCNDDPAICASVPGLRHCEKATREADPDWSPCATSADCMAFAVRCVEQGKAEARAEAAPSATRRTTCVQDGHVWVGTGDDRVVCDDCGLERGSGWIWSLEQPEVSAVRWIETWDESALAFNVLRFHLGDKLAPNVACWRYIDPPRATTDGRDDNVR